jgi:hypothetical protein
MKQITILQENVSPLIIDDKDNSDIESYVKKLSSIMSSNNIVLLHTTSCSIVVRPSKINSVVVRNFDNKNKSNKIKEEISNVPSKQETELSAPPKIDEETIQQESEIIEEMISD